MGEAKRRGTREQRQYEALMRDAEPNHLGELVPESRGREHRPSFSKRPAMLAALLMGLALTGCGCPTIEDLKGAHCKIYNTYTDMIPVMFGQQMIPVPFEVDEWQCPGGQQFRTGHGN
jgi:hypothetical protein